MVSVRFLVCHLPILRVVCYFVPSILPQRRRLNFIWLRFWWRLLVWSASVSALFGAGVGGDSCFGGSRPGFAFRLRFPSHLNYSPRRCGFPITSDLNPPAILHPVPSRRSIPLHPVPFRSILFHPVPSRSIPFRPVLFGSMPGGLVWCGYVSCSILLVVSVWFRFDFGLVSRFRSPFHPISGRPPYSVPSHPSGVEFGFIWLRFGGDFWFGQR